MNFKWIGFGLLALGLAGCGSLSKVSQEGQPEGELVWPEIPGKVTFDNDRGTFGDMNRISLIRDGATRDDIYDLIGRPQFHEGFHVREWDYLFYFQMEDGRELTCQYKILFDENYRARSFFWKTVSPEGESCPPGQNLTLSADALFRFDGGSAGDLLPEGRSELDKLATTLDDKSIRKVNIYGYTDRLGSESYNQALSAQRAETVKAYLVNHGIDGSMISAQGRGEADPVEQCSGVVGRSEIIDCLQPNRRVEIEIKR